MAPDLFDATGGGIAAGTTRADHEVRGVMTSLADRTVAALRTLHTQLADTVPGMSDAQLVAPSGAAEWTVAQVLSHLGSGAEIAHAGLDAALADTSPPGQEFNQRVWDRWNAMVPREQATGFLEHNGRLVNAYEVLPGRQREQLHIDLGFLPAPLPFASVAGMRLNESAQHTWDVRVAADPEAGMPEDVARVLAEHLADGLSFLIGFIGRADAVPAPAVIDIRDSGFAIVIDTEVRLTTSAANPTATFVGPLESAMRLIAGRLGPESTPPGVDVIGSVTLDDLRRVFPGY